MRPLGRATLRVDRGNAPESGGAARRNGRGAWSRRARPPVGGLDGLDHPVGGLEGLDHPRAGRPDQGALRPTGVWTARLVVSTGSTTPGRLERPRACGSVEQVVTAVRPGAGAGAPEEGL